HRFCAEFGIDPALDGFATNPERVARRDETIALVERAFADLTPDQLIPRLETAGIPCGIVRSLDEVYASPQVRSQGLVIDVDHASLGTIELPGPPLRFFNADDGSETETTRTTHHAPPVYGADGDAIREWIRTPPST
ncbi:MAG TPA: CoA transferase, partial [Microbacteriaceae bacterium]|nr:CoA transferase [Microbacteriaceae bacterium]